MSGEHTSPPHLYTVVKQASSPDTILIIPLSWLSVDKTMAAHSSQAHHLQETPHLAPHLQMASTILRDLVFPQSRPIDDVSTNSMNVAENINGVMDLESPKTANGNRERHHPPYASTGGKAPLGEHLAIFVVVSRQPSWTREPRVDAHLSTVNSSATRGSSRTAAGQGDANSPDQLYDRGGPVSVCSDSL
jgi:hypothetical protein